MKTNIFPFRIGEQYELYEFELKYVKTVFKGNNEYLVYEFIEQREMSLFDVRVKKVHLYYNADILSKVIYFLDL